MPVWLKSLLFTLIVPGTVAGVIPAWLTRHAGRAGFPILEIAAAVLWLCGIALYGWCVGHFFMQGRGTPLPGAAPERLVTTGPYRYSRNPMYVAVLLVIAGWLAWRPSPVLAVYALAVWALFSAFIHLYEEPHLLARFDRDYTDYRRDVGRWWKRP